MKIVLNSWSYNNIVHNKFRLVVHTEFFAFVMTSL